jgi:hypothetical protein
VVGAVEATLRQQAHPNFIRWSICNGNPPRVWFARGLGLGVVILSTIVAVVLVLAGGVGRWWRALVAVGWVIGFATLMAAWKGMVGFFFFGLVLVLGRICCPPPSLSPCNYPVKET